MTPSTTMSPPNTLRERVAALEEFKESAHDRLTGIDKKINWMLCGIIAVLLNAVAMLLFKRG